MQEFDVIICGAGPAGSTCALGLFDARLKVALFDKHSFPREKICGDAYGLTAYKILNTISPRFGKQFQEINTGVISRRIKMTSPSGRAYLLDINWPYSSLPRTVFDNYLLEMVKEHTQTTVFENKEAHHVTVENGYALLTTTGGEVFKAKVIVGCDGAHSVVQTTLTKTRESMTEVCPSIRGYYRGVKGIDRDQLEIHFLKTIPKGYFWIFPSTDGLVNVGIGASKETLARHKINMRKSLHEILTQDPAYAERFAEAELVGEIRGWSIPIGYFNGKLPISGECLLLCGDAASLVDPATGEGIIPAMSSARYAARQIKKCFAENNFSSRFMKAYDKQIRIKYFRTYFNRSFIANLYYRIPFFLDLFLIILNRLHGKRKKEQ